MARYADIDELLNNLPDDLPYKASVKRVLIQTTTADVVPKSEVGEWIAEAIHYQNLWCQTEIELENAKQEVAREIFEEIEKHLQEKKTAISIFKDGEDDFYDGEIHALDIFGRIIAELKKKYTESEDTK